MTILEDSASGPAPTTPEWAKAYCGPAHGHTWSREQTDSWPPRIVLASRTGPQEYRLVHDLRAHRPARDHLGNTLYMPVARTTDPTHQVDHHHLTTRPDPAQPDRHPGEP